MYLFIHLTESGDRDRVSIFISSMVKFSFWFQGSYFIPTNTQTIVFIVHTIITAVSL